MDYFTTIQLTAKERETFRKLALREAAKLARALDRAEMKRVQIENARWNALNLSDKLY